MNIALKTLAERVCEPRESSDFRKRDAINRIIERYCEKAALPWIRMFDLEFYRQIYRLNGWLFDPETNNRPGVIGHWTNDIYDRLAPGIRGELHRRVRRNESGRPTQKLTQYLTPEEGKPELLKMLEGVKALMKISSNWDEFKGRMDIVYPKVGDTIAIPFAGGLPRLKKPD